MKKAIIAFASIVTIFTTGASASKKVVIDLSTQTATAYENGVEQFSGRISTGTAKRPTPTGNFRVLEKDKWHKSSSWPKPNGGARMHYMLRLTNYGIAMHLGYVPNYPASHGCVRLENGFAQRMYRWARVGTRVKIRGHAPRRVNRAARVASRKKVKHMPVIKHKKSAIRTNNRSLDILNGKSQRRSHRRAIIDAARGKSKVEYRNPLELLQDR